jgi:hypothetical protein
MVAVSSVELALRLRPVPCVAREVGLDGLTDSAGQACKDLHQSELRKAEPGRRDEIASV